MITHLCSNLIIVYQNFKYSNLLNTEKEKQLLRYFSYVNLNISLNVMYNINAINNIKNMVCIVFSTLGFTLLPFIFSIIRNNICPPSNAGIGSRFIKPTFILISASNDNTDTKPVFAAEPTILNIPTGPASSFILNLPVIKYHTVKNICSIVLKNFVNAYFIDETKVNCCVYLAQQVLLRYKFL